MNLTVKTIIATAAVATGAAGVYFFKQWYYSSNGTTATAELDISNADIRIEEKTESRIDEIKEDKQIMNEIGKPILIIKKPEPSGKGEFGGKSVRFSSSSTSGDSDDGERKIDTDSKEYFSFNNTDNGTR